MCALVFVLTGIKLCYENKNNSSNLDAANFYTGNVFIISSMFQLLLK